MDIFARKSVEAHNRYRALHNVPPLVWCNSLARDAQVWAKKMAKDNKLMHQKDRKSGEGENIFMTSNGNFDDVGEMATESWYSEVSKFNFQHGGHQSGTGHFSQVVWKGSQELGMARAKSKKGAVFVVARYKPAGNDLNSFSENILPKITNGTAVPEPTKADDKLPEKVQNKPEVTSKPEVLIVTKKDGQKDMGPVKLTLKPVIGNTVNDDLKSRILDTHNNYRFSHDAAPLTWSAALAKDAQAWADKIAREGRLEHASREDRFYMGENVCRMSEHFNIEDPLRIWYSERGNYDYNHPGFSLATGHFSQMVWRGTRQVGVGLAKSRDGRLTYVVARYNPPGNILNKFQMNVVPHVTQE